MKLSIYIRRSQLYNIYGTPVIYAGVNPRSLTAIPGSVSDHDWIDVTKDVTNLDKLNITWTQNVDSGGNDTPGAFQSKKAVSNSMAFEDGAYQFIKKWLIDDVAAPLNQIDVQILDDTCGYYTNFAIKNTDIEYCEAGTDVCVFNITIKQKDPNWSCIEKTLVTDNWQGWFQQTPENGKQHPRFSYCVEIRPNATLIIEWYLISIVCGLLLTIFTIIFAIIDVIIFIINLIIDVISLGTAKPNTLGYLSISDMVDYFINLYIETAGCGREHPAPLVRDYISNVCDKCGIAYTPESIPFFFAPKMDIDSSDGFKSQVDNPYYNLCWMEATAQRGIRRIRNNNLFTGSNPNNTDFFIPQNAPLLTLDMFLDKLKPVFNAEWRIQNVAGVPTLLFQRKDFYINKTPLYDFSETGADRGKLLTGICFTWNEVKLPAYTTGIYAQDALDSCANECVGVAGQMNGIANFGQTDSNPNYSGVLDKTTKFGATKFRLDGVSYDYIYDAMQQLSISQLLNPQMVPQMRKIDDYMEQYSNYGLLLKDEICQLPKLLIWDGVEYLHARCVRDKVPINTPLTPSDPMPANNPKYPYLDSSLALVTRPWNEAYPTKTYVLGSSWTIHSDHTGLYQVNDYFGATIAHAAARLVNYPMYFQPEYLGTLWDYFHWIDDPRYNPGMNMSWKAEIDLCCEDLDKLGLIGDGTAAKIYDPIRLPFKYYPIGVIKQILASYDSSNVLGKHIEITGNS